MQIDLTKGTLTREEVKFILERLSRAARLGLLTTRSEANPYLLASYAGVEGKGISPKWNVKIYTYNRKNRGHSLVCVDFHVLAKLIEGDYGALTASGLPVIRIDDAGWGFPLCGVMVGASDEHIVRTAVVPVEYFRSDTENGFLTKRYLKEYTALALHLLEQFGASPKTHRIEICTGYVNQPLREELRRHGYEVRVAEIKGLLQEQLESMYRDYIFEELGVDIYYDPKQLDKSQIARLYQTCVNYGKKHCPDKIKTGWGALQHKEQSYEF
jgi:hypothetical protein